MSRGTAHQTHPPARSRGRGAASSDQTSLPCVCSRNLRCAPLLLFHARGGLRQNSHSCPGAPFSHWSMRSTKPVFRHGAHDLKPQPLWRLKAGNPIVWPCWVVAVTSQASSAHVEPHTSRGRKQASNLGNVARRKSMMAGAANGSGYVVVNFFGLGGFGGVYIDAISSSFPPFLVLIITHTQTSPPPQHINF